jgi:translocation and assembly module TamB
MKITALPWNKLLILALALPLALLLILFTALQTSPVKDFITRTVNTLDPGGLNVEIKNLHGLLPFQIRVDRLTCSDARGEFIDIHRLKLDLRPWSLSQGGPGIDLLSVQKCSFTRLPEIPPGQDQVPEQSETEAGGHFSSPVPLYVRKLVVDRLSLGQELLGQRAELSVDIQAAAQSASDWDLNCSVQELDTPGLVLQAAAGMHGQDSRLELNLSFQDRPDGLALGRLGLPISEPLRVDVRGSGPLANWSGTVGMNLAKTSLAAAQLDLNLGRKRFEVTAGAEIFPTPLLPPGLSPLAPELDRIDLQLQAEADQNLSRIELSRLRLSSRLARIDLQGRSDLKARTADVSGSVRLPDLASFQPLLPMPLTGAASLDLGVSGGFSRPDLALDLRLTDLTGLPHPAGKLIGPELTLHSDLGLQAGNRLSLDSLRISGQQIGFTARGTLGLADQNLTAAWRLQGPDLAALDLGDIAGEVTAAGQLNGTVRDAAADISVQVDNLTGSGLRPSRLKAGFAGQIRPQLPEVDGDFDLKLSRNTDRLHLRSGIRFAGGVMHLDDLDLDGPQSTLRASAELDTKARELLADLRLRVKQAAALQPFFQVPVQGGLSLSASLNGPWTEPRVSASGRITDLKAAGAQVGALDFRAELEDPKTLAGSMTLRGERIAFGTNRVHSLNLTAKGSQGLATGRLAMNGSLGEDLELVNTFRLRREEDTLLVALPKGEGRYGDLPFSWVQAVQAEVHTAGGSLSWPELRLGPGTIRLTAQTEDTAVQGSLRAQGLDLSLLPLPPGLGLVGNADFQARVSGSLAEPRIRYDLKIAELYSKLGQAEDRPGMQIQADGSVASKHLSTRIAIQGGEDLDLHADLDLPLALSLQPAGFRLGSSLSADLQGRIDLGLLSTFLPLEGQDLAGIVTLDLRASGNLPQPPVEGSIELTKGRLENYSSGTLLQDLRAAVQLSGYQASLKRLEATDGEGGTIRASGTCDFVPDTELAYSLQTEFSQAELVRMDTATAGISGNLGLSGTTAGADIQGDIKLFPVDIGIPNPAPAGLEGLTIVREDEKKQEQKQTQDKAPPSFAQNTSLDIRVDIPGGCYVRGRGLDSEWNGELRIQGAASEPQISGFVQVMRGHLDLLTKRFSLDEGRITFLSRFPPQPELKLVASTQVNDLLAKVNISGQATEPSIELSSEPALPRDEILARILFNRNLSQITPLQAVKLAWAVRTLTSGGSGGFMTSLRKNMGLDELSIESGSNDPDSQGVTVGAGKYLTEDIYFKVEKGMEDDAGRVTVDIQLTPRISFESRAGSDHQGLYITWSYTY